MFPKKCSKIDKGKIFAMNNIDYYFNSINSNILFPQTKMECSTIEQY